MLREYAKRGAHNTLFLGIGTVITRLMAFALLRFFLDRLSLYEFGIWDFYQTFFSVGLDLLTSCAIISLSRFYVLYNEDPCKQRESVGNACAMVLLAAVSAAGLLIVLQLCGFSFTSYPSLTVINTASYALFAVVLAYTRIREWLWTYVTLMIVQSSASLGLSVVGVAWGYGVDSLFYATIISTVIFIPAFIVLLHNHWSFSWQRARIQLAVSMPLLASNLLFALFLNIDRVMIRYGVGYELLGAYSLLWRFGALYQFFCITLMNAAPVILFNAEKESNGSYLIRSLLSYGVLAVVSVGMYAALVTYYAIGLWFPVQYHYLATYVPIFFFPLIMLQLGRLFQSAFLLENNTLLVPLISIIAAGVQAGALWIALPYGLYGVCSANTVAFSLFALLSYIGGNYVHRDKPLHGSYIIRLVLLLAVCSTLALAAPMGVAFVWPVGLWLMGYFTHGTDDGIH